MLIGIIGRPNVGKSSFYKALTLADVDIGNFPFTTLKPNQGVGFVKTDCPETFFNLKCNPKQGYCIEGKRFVPVRLIDVPGLVRDAHKGRGLGNQFLDYLRQADAFIHVVDISGKTNENGDIIDGNHNPIEDIKLLENELDNWVYQILEENWENVWKDVRYKHTKVSETIANNLNSIKIKPKVLQSIISGYDLENHIREVSEEEKHYLATNIRKAAFPFVIVANKCDLPSAEANLSALREHFSNYTIIPCSAEAELALKSAHKNNMLHYIPGEKSFTINENGSLSERQRKALEHITNNVLLKYSSTGVQRAIDTAVFEILKYITVFPGAVNKMHDSQGRTLPDAFLMPPDSTAYDFAMRVHTDLADKFIKAIDVRNEKAVGRDYILKDKDIIEIIGSK